MKPTKRLLKKIEKCPKVWLIGQWAHWGIREYRWTGKWTKGEKPQPIVWYFTDHNGEYEQWLKVPIGDTTTGWGIAYSFHKGVAEEIAEAMEERVRLSRKGETDSVGKQYNESNEYTVWVYNGDRVEKVGNMSRTGLDKIMSPQEQDAN